MASLELRFKSTISSTQRGRACPICMVKGTCSTCSAGQTTNHVQILDKACNGVNHATKDLKRGTYAWVWQNPNNKLNVYEHDAITRLKNLLFGSVGHFGKVELLYSFVVIKFTSSLKFTELLINFVTAVFFQSSCWHFHHAELWISRVWSKRQLFFPYFLPRMNAEAPAYIRYMA